MQRLRWEVVGHLLYHNMRWWICIRTAATSHTSALFECFKQIFIRYKRINALVFVCHTNPVLKQTYYTYLLRWILNKDMQFCSIFFILSEYWFLLNFKMMQLLFSENVRLKYFIKSAHKIMNTSAHLKSQ